MRSRYFLLFFHLPFCHYTNRSNLRHFGLSYQFNYKILITRAWKLFPEFFFVHFVVCVCVPLPLLSLYLSLQSEIRKKHNITVVNDLEIYRSQWMHFNRKISTNIQHYTNTYIHRNISMFYYPFRRFCMVINFNLIHLLCCTHLTHSHIHKYPYIIFT